ncbi:unnamed protein product, partial [marine sediment metagenome]
LAWTRKSSEAGEDSGTAGLRSPVAAGKDRQSEKCLLAILPGRPKGRTGSMRCNGKKHSKKAFLIKPEKTQGRKAYKETRGPARFGA